ncbi:SusC/RagA family TonB-linked outer membrane protein [uncultured Tenacibaculum sp.]|uniref:SusC/RagA family TonB-linked outer membrane protein n=1 Tax=uncultured Tenacibaculum sp. TaxID=174713 RepID=UPI00261121D2|nr:SusC/RagA family TonB-linked outer membrane protein [uncultured Tenacibaculum sp.]
MKKTKLFFSLFLLCFSLISYAQQTIKGSVTEKGTGEPLPGVSILVKGEVRGTETDFNGNYEIKNVKASDILVFSFIGMKTTEIKVGNQTSINVQLEEDGQVLDEVVVVGYGTTTVKDATGSVEAITEKQFTKGNIVTPENLLNGRVSGVSINTSGAPGSGSQIRIRGGSSINASNDPLIIIDGLPITNSNVGGSRGILATINPNDIESFSVLKDASATAIYGSRASNGVIIITTKKGKSTWSLDFDTQVTTGKINNRINVFSADEFRNLVNSQPISGTLDASLLGNANTDWQDQIFRNTVSTIHNLTARGTMFDVIPVRLSVGFNEQEGALLTSEFIRRNVSVALSPSLLNDHLKINLNYTRAFENNRFADSGQIGAALRYDPTQPVFDSSSPFGGFYQHLNGTGVANGTQNPVAALLQTNNTGASFRQYGNLQFDYKMHFLPELRAVINLGYDRTAGSTKNFSSLQIPAAAAAVFVGNDSESESIRVNQLLDGYLNYKKDFSDKISGDFTAGYSYQKFKFDGSNTGNRRDATSLPQTFADPDVVLIGFFGRANFSFLDKYLLTLNYRRDGTSRFSSKNRWGNFPGAALAWKISEEDFLKESSFVSSLKLRASYGVTGQQEIDEKDVFLSRYRAGDQNSQYLFGGVPIATNIPSAINEALKWEETATIEFGIDYGLFNDRITGSVSAFQKNSTDLLFDAPTPLNFTNRIIQNVGELQIRGLEFSINSNVIDTNDMSLDFNFNGIVFDREIKDLTSGFDFQTGGISGGTGSDIQINRVGQAPRAFYVLKQLYDTNGNPIEGGYLDINGDGIINASDRYLKESPDPDVILGFQSNFNYKNFDLSFNLRANIGNYVYNNVNSSRAQLNLLRDNAVLGNIPTSVLQTNFRNTADVLLSDIYVENASFLRMDNITIGYTFNRPIKKFSKNSIRIWTGMQNVFTWTNYSGLDPEVTGSDPGIDNVIYPRSRNILFGANIKF